MIVSSEVQLNTTSIVFEGAVGERCVIITVTDDDNMNMGNSSYDLVLGEVSQMSSVPVLVYPNTVSILIIDDDTPGNMAAIKTLLIDALILNTRNQF